MTIVPANSLDVYRELLVAPTVGVLSNFVREGERRTFPYVSHIRAQCEMELTLDKCAPPAAPSKPDADLLRPVQTGRGSPAPRTDRTRWGRRRCVRHLARRIQTELSPLAKVEKLQAGDLPASPARSFFTYGVKDAACPISTG